jgi:hypothetical protein
MKITREWFEAWAERHDVDHNLKAHIHPWDGGQEGAIYLGIYDDPGEGLLALFWSSPKDADFDDCLMLLNVETGLEVRPEG